MSNRLASATSPYLLQHADNPVDWWEWGDDAFAEARRRDVPLFISVGYSACHWCHVMAHESFEDEAIADYLRENFVSVKVDREERPDVDAVYMTATQALTGHGGWPMTVFVTPDGEPFYAGTYFPPTPHHNLPSFGQLIEAVHGTWTADPERVREAAGRITSSLAERQMAVDDAEMSTAAVTDAVKAGVDSLASSYDYVRGGFGGAPKFPPSMVLEFLLRAHALSGDPRARAMVEGTCAAMARGGMYDQLAGGFARYSVDADWVVPHFEKMLYDNALLLRVYAHWWRATGDPLAARIVEETAGFLLSDMRSAEGGFISALDADTEGVEGKAYAWTPQQLIEVLGDSDGQWAAALFEVTESGTFEHGLSVLQLRTDPQDVDRWLLVRDGLLQARANRAQPGRDDKIVAAWNGLAIAALAEAGALFERPEWITAAVESAQLLVSVHMTPQGRLRRVSRDGAVGVHAGVLDDHACVAEAFDVLYQVTGEPFWLERAEGLLEIILEHFGLDDTGGFFDTADDAEQLVLRPRDPSDNASPSGWSAAASALLMHSALTDDRRYREAAEASLAPLVSLGARHARFAGWGMATAVAWLDGPREVAILTPDPASSLPTPDPASSLPTPDPASSLYRAALLSSAPGLVIVRGVVGSAQPLLADRTVIDGVATAYLCRHFVCDAPTTSPTDLARTLNSRTP